MTRTRPVGRTLRFIILLLARWTCPNNRPTYPTYLMCRIGTAKFFTLLLLLYHTSVKPHGFKQHRIPNRIVACGITVHIVKHQFLKYTCFAAVSSPRSHRPHSYFRRTVTAQYRSVVYKNDAAAPACGGNFGNRRCSPILFCFLLYKLPQKPPKRL